MGTMRAKHLGIISLITLAVILYILEMLKANDIVYVAGSFIILSNVSSGTAILLITKIRVVKSLCKLLYIIGGFIFAFGIVLLKWTLLSTSGVNLMIIISGLYFVAVLAYSYVQNNANGEV
jgi:hypothetical protein